jgi:hypothetical protein
VRKRDTKGEGRGGEEVVMMAETRFKVQKKRGVGPLSPEAAEQNTDESTGAKQPKRYIKLVT